MTSLGLFRLLHLQHLNVPLSIYSELGPLPTRLIHLQSTWTPDHMLQEPQGQWVVRQTAGINVNTVPGVDKRKNQAPQRWKRPTRNTTLEYVCPYMSRLVTRLQKDSSTIYRGNLLGFELEDGSAELLH